jgi:hypothetical protein
MRVTYPVVESVCHEKAEPPHPMAYDLLTAAHSIGQSPPRGKTSADDLPAVGAH